MVVGNCSYFNRLLLRRVYPSPTLFAPISSDVRLYPGPNGPVMTRAIHGGKTLNQRVSHRGTSMLGASAMPAVVSINSACGQQIGNRPAQTV